MILIEAMIRMSLALLWIDAITVHCSCTRVSYEANSSLLTSIYFKRTILSGGIENQSLCYAPFAHSQSRNINRERTHCVADSDSDSDIYFATT